MNLERDETIKRRQGIDRADAEAIVDLGAIRKAMHSATPGPYLFVVRQKGDPMPDGAMIAAVAPGHQIWATSCKGGTYPNSDGKLLAASWQYLTDLLALVDDLRSALARVEAERDEAKRQLARTASQLTEARAEEAIADAERDTALSQRDRLLEVLQDEQFSRVEIDRVLADFEAAKEGTRVTHG